MRTITRPKIEGVRWVSTSEMKSIVDKRARTVLNVSGQTFLRNRKKGMYAELDADSCPGIIELTLIAPSTKVASTRGRKNP